MEWCKFNHLFYSQRIKKHLLYSSLSNSLIELDEAGYKKISEAIQSPHSIDENDDFFKHLVDRRFFIKSNENELNKLILSSLTKSFNPSTLSLTIAPTQACNFNCPYCYESNRQGKPMTSKVQNGIVDFVKRSEPTKVLNIVWYGGEPTLAINELENLSSKLQETVECYNAFMVTNGYALDKIISKLEHLSIRGIQITLDGTAGTHDKTRKLLNGGGTFYKILENIDRVVAKTNIHISVRMNVSKDNSDEFVNLHRLLHEKYGKRVNLYPAFVRDYNNNCKSGFCYDDNKQKAIFLKEVFTREKIYTKDLYPVRKNLGCMMQQLNAFVIGVKGELYKCWHHLGKEDKIVGDVFSEKKIINYSLFADMMIANNAIFDDKCKSCVLFPSCDGGCADIKKNKNEDYCIPAKAMFDDFIDIRHFVCTHGKSKAPVGTK